MRIFILLISFYCGSVVAGDSCKLTDELMNLRQEVYDSARRPYRDCRESVSSYLYWKAYAECKKLEPNQQLFNSCLADAGYRVGEGAFEENLHCEVLYVDLEDIKSQFRKILLEKNLMECSSVLKAN